MKTLLRIIVWTLVSVAALGVAIVAITSTPEFQKWLEGRITARLAQLTGGPVKIEGLSFHPLLLELTADRLVIQGAETPTDLPLLMAKGVIVQISPVSLLDFHLTLRQFSWVQADVSIFTGPGGITNLSASHRQAAAAPALSNLMNVSAERVTLGDTNVFWNGKGLPFSAQATNLALLLRETAPGRYGASVSSIGIRFGGKLKALPSVAFSTQFDFTAQGAEVKSFRWRLGDLSGGAAGAVSWEPALRAEFQYSASGNVGPLTHLWRLPGLVNGEIKITGVGNYQTGSVRVEGQGHAWPLVFRLGAFRPAPVGLSFTYAAENQQAQLSNFVLSSVWGEVRGSGSVQFGSGAPRFDVSARAERLALGALEGQLDGIAPPLQAIHPDGSVNGTMAASWRGSFQDLVLTFLLNVEPPSKPHAGALPLKGTIQGDVRRLKTTRINLKEVRLQTPSSTIRGQGEVGSLSSPFTFQITTTSFQEWRPLLNFLMQLRLPDDVTLEQPAVFSAALSGTLGRLTLRAQLRAGPFRTRKWRWSGLEARLQISHDVFQISNASLTHERSVIHFNGSAQLVHWQLMNSSAIRLGVAAQDTPLRGLVTGAGIHFPLDGMLTARFDLDGTVTKLGGSGEVALVNMRAGKAQLPSVNAQLRIKGNEWNLDRLSFTQGRGRASGEGYVNRSTGAYFLRLDGKNFSLADFTHHANSGKKLARPEVAGNASFVLVSNGTIERPNAALNLMVSNLAIYGDAVGDLSARVDWHGQSLEGSGSVRGPGGEIHFASAVETSAPYLLTLSGNYKNLEIAPWIHLVAGRSLGASVAASGAFYLSGPLAYPSQLQGRSEIGELQIRVPPLSFENDHAVTINYSGDALHFSPFHMKGPGTNFAVQGAIAFGARPKLAVDVTGRADATLLSLLDPSLRAYGSSQLEVRLGGTPANPSLHGSLAIRDVSMGYADLPIQLSGLNGTLQFEGDRASISKLQGIIGGGTISISGAVVLGGIPRYRVRARLRQVRVNYPSDFTSLLDGQLVLTGTAEHGELTGGVAVRNVFVSPGFDVLTLLAESNSHLEMAPPSSSGTAASRLGLNIRVSSPQGLRLDTRDAHLVADVNLTIRGTLANPVALGDVHARSGSAIFQGNRYTITRGDLSMDNPFHTEPVLDLEAQTRVERYDLTVEVSGPLDQLHLAYRSDPPLPVEDIVSLIALGYTRQTGEAGLASTSNRSLSSSVGASALLSQALSSEIGGRIQQLFGVSRIKINPEANEPGVGTGPRVTVEQQLTPDFTVTYITNTNNSLYRVIRIEWDLSQNVSLIGMRDQNGIIGMELKFRRRFK